MTPSMGAEKAVSDGVGRARPNVADARVADVSVIVPVLNEETYLPNLLASLAEQTVGVRELIVVDAGSMDGTEAISRAAGARWLPGGGLPGISRNLGAERAVGEWLLFLDADVRLPPTAIAEILVEVRGERFRYF